MPADKDTSSGAGRGVQVSRFHAILRFQAQINADPTLDRAEVKVAMQYCQRTSAEVFAETGELVTWQSVDLQAAESVQDERTVQRATRELQRRGHIAVEAGGGRGLTNRITLLLCDIAQTPAHAPPFSGPERVANSFAKGGKSVGKPRHSYAARTVRTNRTFAQTTEVEHGAPRSRADALGAHGAGLRKRLNERAEWLYGAKLAGHSSDVVTLAVVTLAQGDNIRKHCEADILDEFGVARLEFVQMQLRA